MAFSNVVYGQIAPETVQNTLDSIVSSGTPCTCDRLMDIVFVMEQTSEVSIADFTAMQSFAISLSSSFTISPTSVNFGIVTYDSSAQTQTPLSVGVTPSNVQSSISSLACPSKKACGKSSGSGAHDAALAQAQSLLKNSIRVGKADQVIILVAKSLADTTGIIAAQNAQISVVVVSTTSALTLPTNTIFFPRQSADDLGGGTTDDVSGAICSLSSYPCGQFCCGICDTTCGTCIPVDACPTSTTCEYEWTLQNNSGCCVKNSAIQKCTPRPGICESAMCDTISGTCTYSNNCQSNGPSDCYTYQCDNGQCTKVPKKPSSACRSAQCVNEVYTETDVQCSTNTSCFTYKCDNKIGCISEIVPPPASTSCDNVTCDPTNGYSVVHIVGCSNCPNPTDPCLKASYINNTCQNVSKCSAPQNNCFVAFCAAGICNYLPKNCSDSDPCTDDSCDAVIGKCVNVLRDCSTSNACMLSTCNATTGNCDTVPLDCDDGILCTQDSCDTSKGCIHTPVHSVCDTGNGCTIGTCDLALGCVIANITCAESQNYCDETTCLSTFGCINTSRACKSNGNGNTDAYHCVISTCSELNAMCVDQVVECNAGLLTGNTNPYYF